MPTDVHFAPLSELPVGALLRKPTDEQRIASVIASMTPNDELEAVTETAECFRESTVADVSTQVLAVGWTG